MRISRPIALAVVALCLAASVPVAAAPGTPPMPAAAARILWDNVCVNAAGGTVSPQVALVCTHRDFPMWSDRSLMVLENVCVAALKGDFVYRSEYPTEYAACFFD
jgi:hypothetical protein